MSTLKKFALNGDTVMPFKQTEGSIVDKIPAGLYCIKESMFGYYLEKKASSIELPKKIYGSTLDRAARCFSTYDRTSEPLTLGLFGSKGAGKTLLANVLAQTGIDRNMPVIDVSESFNISTEYLAFIESLGPVIVLFDEFLKKLSNLDIPSDKENSAYGAKRERAHTAQDNMLTFLQGTSNSKRLTILIDNDAQLLSEYIKERPGRMRYRYNYEAIEPAVVEAVGKDSGLTAAQIESLVIYTQLTQTTFDVMRVIIQEWTFYPEAQLSDITDVLNVPSARSYEPETFSIKVLEIGEGSKIRNTDPLTGVAAGKNIHVSTTAVNPHIDHPEITDKDEFYENSELRETFTSWEDYQKNRFKPILKHEFYLNPRTMIGYSAIACKYQLECGTILEVRSNQDKKIKTGTGYF